MRNRDVLIGYEKEGIIIVVRPVDDGMHELIGQACVSQLDSDQANVAHGAASMISLC